MNNLRGTAPLLQEYNVEIVAVGAGLASEHTNASFPVNAVMRLPDEETLNKFLGDPRYLELKEKYRNPAYQTVNLSVFKGREPRKFD
jgi:hypothetical protein